MTSQINHTFYRILLLIRHVIASGRKLLDSKKVYIPKAHKRKISISIIAHLFQFQFSVEITQQFQSL